MQEEEIELIDIFRILWKRRKLILLGTLFLTIGAAGISLLLPKVYEVSTIIEPGIRPIADVNGQIVNEMPVVTPEALREGILGGAYDARIQKKLNIAPKDYPKIRVVTPKNTLLVKISIESSKPEQALAILNELVSLVGSDIQEKLESEKSKIGHEIKLTQIYDQSLVEKIKLVEKQTTAVTAKMQDLEKNRERSMASRTTDAMSVLLYSNEIQNQQIYLNGLQEKLKNLETEAQGSSVRIDNLRLKLSLIKSTSLTKPPSIPDKPVKPKKPLIVALAFMVGLMGSMLLVFLLEYFERAGGVGVASEA
jgi:capsular polysaccharide biosynthesis protein